MGQFFATNPASRPASGPREGRWSRETPKDWRAALGAAPQAPPPASTEKDSGEDEAA